MYLDFAFHLNKCDLTVLGRLISFAFLYFTSGHLVLAKKKTREFLLLSKWKRGICDLQFLLKPRVEFVRKSVYQIIAL